MTLGMSGLTGVSPTLRFESRSLFDGPGETESDTAIRQFHFFFSLVAHCALESDIEMQGTTVCSIPTVPVQVISRVRSFMQGQKGHLLVPQSLSLRGNNKGPCGGYVVLMLKSHFG
jgi:hypothetical protein